MFVKLFLNIKLNIAFCKNIMYNKTNEKRFRK